MVAYSGVVNSLGTNLRTFSLDTVSWVVKDVHRAGIPLINLMVMLVREHSDDLIGHRYHAYQSFGNDRNVRLGLVQYIRAVSNAPPPPPEFVIVAVQMVAKHQYKRGTSALLADIQSVPVNYFKNMFIPEETLASIREIDPALFSLLKERFIGSPTGNARSYSAIVQSFHQALARFDLEQAEEEANRGGIPLTNLLHAMRKQEGFKSVVRAFRDYIQSMIEADRVPPPAMFVALAVRVVAEHQMQGIAALSADIRTMPFGMDRKVIPEDTLGIIERSSIELYSLLQENFQVETRGGGINYQRVVQSFYQMLCDFNKETLEAMEQFNRGWIPLTHLLKVMIEKGGYELVIATLRRHVQPMVSSQNMPPPAAFVAIAARALAEHQYMEGVSALCSDVQSMPHNYFFQDGWITEYALRKIEGMDVGLHSLLIERFLGCRGITLLQ